MSFSVSIVPPTFITTAGSNITFTCIIENSDAEEIQWIVNGSPLHELNLTNIVSFNVVGFGLGTLRFTNLSLIDNLTAVQCVADLQDGTTASSDRATVILQGLCCSGWVHAK